MTMALTAVLLQYAALFGFAQTECFQGLSNSLLRWIFILALLISLVLMGDTLGWTIAIPIWLGLLTIFGLLQSWGLAMKWCPYRLSILIGLTVLLIYLLSLRLFG